MNILILDPFYEYSHRVWAEGLQKHSRYKIEILTLSPHHWKWRMTGGAIELAEKYKQLDYEPDLIIATDMLDLGSFLAQANIDQSKMATALYFHENQITYPWNNDATQNQKERNHHYGFINFTSCLIADQIFFNSDFHNRIFNDALASFLKIFPRFGHQKYLDIIAQKSKTLPIGLDLKITKTPNSDVPCFLWNHRWEHDKNPETFFNTLYDLKKDKVNFELIVLGKSYKNQPVVFEEVKDKLREEIIHFGYVESNEEYGQLIEKANILLVTSNQDFFGISIVEAIAAGLYPILPNRLAYPEHIASKYQTEVFYDTDEEILPMVKRTIEFRKYVHENNFAAYVEKYDWSKLINSYDRHFSELKKTYI